MFNAEALDNERVRTKRTKVSLRVPPKDLRRFARLRVNLSARVSLVPESSPDDAFYDVLRPPAFPVIVTNLSPTGLYFLSAVSIELTQQLWIALRLYGDSHLMRALVLREQAHLRGGKKVYGYGVQFVKSRYAARSVAAVLRYLQHEITDNQAEI